MADHIGQQFGNYRLTCLLGQGGFADVYLGEHIHLGTQAAIKVLQMRLGGSNMEQFRHEARTIASLVHPHIVRILDFGVEDGIPFLVMDYAPNGTLRQRHPKGTRLAAASIVPSVRQVATALQYAHDRKLIHRDVKPDNMLLGRHDDVLLSDFGLVSTARSTESQMTKEMAGTLPYMAPEQINGKPRLASDQYSLGIVIYEWLSGDYPFHGSLVEIATQHLATPPAPLHGRIPGVSPAVEEVVFTALAKDPQQRFSSMMAFATAFEQASQTVLSDPAPLSQPSQPPFVFPSPAVVPTPTGRHRLWLVALSLLLAVLVIAGGSVLVGTSLFGKMNSTPRATVTTSARSSSPTAAVPASPTSAKSSSPTATVPASPTSAKSSSPTAAVPASPTSARSSSPTATVPALTATAYASTPQGVYTISIGSASGQQLYARAYFGQLESVMQTLGSIAFNVDPNFRQAHPTLCVGTVVVTNVPGNTAVVYALGLGTGWTAAEGVPNPMVAGGDRNVHQQLVVPPPGTNSGVQWQAGAEVKGASFDLKTSTYTLKLEDQIGSTAHWFVGGQGPVECTMT